MARINSETSLDDLAPLWRCGACETLFEQGVADDLDGLPRCPQCGVAEGRVITENPEAEIVIRRTTRFR